MVCMLTFLTFIESVLHLESGIIFYKQIRACNSLSENDFSSHKGKVLNVLNGPRVPLQPRWIFCISLAILLSVCFSYTEFILLLKHTKSTSAPENICFPLHPEYVSWYFITVSPSHYPCLWSYVTFSGKIFLIPSPQTVWSLSRQKIALDKAKQARILR